MNARWPSKVKSLLNHSKLQIATAGVPLIKNGNQTLATLARTTNQLDCYGVNGLKSYDVAPNHLLSLKCAFHKEGQWGRLVSPFFDIHLCCPDHSTQPLTLHNGRQPPQPECPHKKCLKLIQVHCLGFSGVKEARPMVFNFIKRQILASEENI